MLFVFFFFTKHVNIQKNLPGFPSDCWAQSLAYKWYKYHLLLVEKNEDAEWEEEEEEKEEDEATVSHMQTQLVWPCCLSESKMGDWDWEKDERMRQGTVEEEEAY